MKKIAVFCVGNRLHLDDGIGPAVYDEVFKRFDVPEGIEMFDLGVLTTSIPVGGGVLSITVVFEEDNDPEHVEHRSLKGKQKQILHNVKGARDSVAYHYALPCFHLIAENERCHGGNADHIRDYIQDPYLPFLYFTLKE